MKPDTTIPEKKVSAALLAQLCADIYGVRETGYWHNYWEHEEVHVGHYRAGESDVLVFRGSAEPLDFIRDAEGWPVFHSQLGFLHAGFARHMDDVLAETREHLGDRVVITGHSLGGARARILAALRVVHGLPVDQVCTFGSPRPGFVNVSRIIQKSGMVHESYRNRHDPVPLVPGIMPLWEHPEPWIELNEAPAVNAFDPLRDHSSQLYAAGLKKMGDIAAAVGQELK